MSCRRYSSTRRACASTGSSAAAISRRKMTLAAPSAPMTAISLVGQAKDRSAPIDLESITMYAPPYALRSTIEIRGTVAAQYA